MIPAIEPMVFSKGVKSYWIKREEQSAKQKISGKKDQGQRGEGTGGKQMNEIAKTIIKLLVDIGVPTSDIFWKNKKDLPGFYRTDKQWDILIVSEKQLQAAIELKSHVGKSVGNNINNRIEEALGNSEDFWTAYNKGSFASPQPWLGYLLLLEDNENTRAKPDVQESHFPVMKEFKNITYAQRYEIFCRKAVLERKYTSACLLYANKSKANESMNYSEPASDISANQFLTQLLAHMLMMESLKKNKQTRL